MRKLTYILIIIAIIISCRNEMVRVENMTFCNGLLDLLDGSPQGGGEWVADVFPIGYVNNPLIGDNPEICFSDVPCGNYQFIYTVESTDCDGCTDSSTLRINNTQCCDNISVSITCTIN